MRHLFKDTSKDLKLFINPTYEFTEVVQQFCSVTGIRAGVIINKRLIIGGVYNFQLQKITLPESLGFGQLGMQMEGIHLEYTLWPLQKVHLSFPLSGGLGQLKISGSTTPIAPDKPNFFFAEPGMMIETNIWKYARFGFGGSYRYTANVEYNGLTTNDLNGFSAVVSLKMGLFNYEKREY